MTMKTVVYQSYRTTEVAPWIECCLASVRDWTAAQGWDYRFIGDEIFDLAPGWYRDKAQGRTPVITDLCRLILARDLLAEGYVRVIWLDADVLIFDPENLHITVSEEFAFGQETWIQPGKGAGKGRRLKATTNVHNALCVFTEGNSFLDFYIHACLSVVRRIEGPMVPQLVGPKLLTALHNILGFQLAPEVGAFSPLLLSDIAGGGGPALDLYRESAPATARAANLCASQETEPDLYEDACRKLLEANPFTA